MVGVDSRLGLKIQAAANSLSVCAQPFYKLQPAASLAVLYFVGVELHRVALGSTAYVPEGELPLQVAKKLVLQDEYKLTAQRLECSDLVV